MADPRQPFGATLADFAYDIDGTTGDAEFVAGSTVAFWNDQQTGAQYTDLLDLDGVTAIDHVITSDGTDGYAVGTIPQLYGPPGVYMMWASADGGPRSLIVTPAAGDVAAAALAAAGTVAGNLTAHIGSAPSNPHHVTVAMLDDVAIATTPANGAVLSYDTGTAKWIANTSSGLNPASFVKTAGGSIGQIANGDVTTQWLKLLLPAGDRTGTAAPNTISVQWNSGTDGAPVYQETFRLNEYGEFRLQPSATNRIAARIKQFSGSQTADLTQWTDFANVPLAWVTATGLIRAANLGRSLTFSIAGAVNTGVGGARIYNDTGATLVIRSVRASVGTAPTGASLIVDVNISGVTIFTTQANRPTIAAAGNTSGKVTNANVATIPDGSYFTIDVDQVGSGTHGSDLVVQVDVY